MQPQKFLFKKVSGINYLEVTFQNGTKKDLNLNECRMEVSQDTKGLQKISIIKI